MKISIITPTLNQGIFIEDTIRSVMEQNYSNYEHIVIDGGSTDNTISILKKYPHLKWISEKDSGQSNAINKGFKLATGDIVAWLNSDDYYEKNIFGEVAKYFSNNPDCMILYGDITFIDENKCTLFEVIGDRIDFEKLVNNPDIVCQPSFFWKREMIIKYGGVDENLRLVMDLDLFLRICKFHRPFYINKNLSYYRYYHENKSLSMQRRQVYEIYKVYKNNRIDINHKILIFLIKKYIYSFSIINRIKKIIG